MAQNFQDKVSSLSDKQLEEYIERRRRFTPESVEAAVAELEKRGRIFSFAELRAIDHDLRELRRGQQVLVTEVAEEGWLTTDDDEERGIPLPKKEPPLLYSPTSVIVFALISFFFGAGMLAFNCSRAKNRRGFWEVLLFGLSYLFFEFLLMSILGKNLWVKQNAFLMELVLNGIGALILIQFFWKKYIGAQTQYQPKPVWIPVMIYIMLIVAMAVFAVILFGPNVADIEAGLHKLIPQD